MPHVTIVTIRSGGNGQRLGSGGDHGRALEMPEGFAWTRHGGQGPAVNQYCEAGHIFLLQENRHSNCQASLRNWPRIGEHGEMHAAVVAMRPHPQHPPPKARRLQRTQLSSRF